MLGVMGFGMKGYFQEGLTVIIINRHAHCSHYTCGIAFSGSSLQNSLPLATREKGTKYPPPCRHFNAQVERNLDYDI